MKPKPNPFHSAHAALSYADKKLDEFELQLEAYIKRGPFRINVQTVKGGGLVRKTYFVHTKIAPPEDLERLLEDCVSRLRSALDQLINTAARVYGADKKLKMVYIQSDREFENWIRSKSARKLPGPAIDWIRSKQPFAQPNNRLSILDQLNKLWTEQKHHQSLHLAPAVFAGGLSGSGRARVARFGNQCLTATPDDWIGYLECADADDDGLELAFELTIGISRINRAPHNDALQMLHQCYVDIRDNFVPSLTNG